MQEIGEAERKEKRGTEQPTKERGGTKSESEDGIRSLEPENERRPGRGDER